jgi:hypothetical protein
MTGQLNFNVANNPISITSTTTTANNGIQIKNTVVNPSSQQDLFYSIGAHPGFQLHAPLEEYSIELFDLNGQPFAGDFVLQRHLIHQGLYTGETELVEFKNGRLDLDYNLFQSDAIVFKHEEIGGISVFRGMELPVKHVFICTGTGIAPFRSMIQESLMQGCETVLVFGNRWKEDILYSDHWETLQENNPLFKFIPVLSREEAAGCKTGYVHPYYERELKGLEDARIYVCGWKDMCMETRDRLKDMGFNRRQYFFEQYD